MAVPGGAKTTVVLSKERAVEIDLSQPAKRKLTAISDGKPAFSKIQPIGEAMTIIGTDGTPRAPGSQSCASINRAATETLPVPTVAVR